ncbi:MFS transporter [Sinomonas atrocyanea]|jgi:DHA2 family multidrug resistance protein-like MFS transporter|uniref:MFS transporter n=1 Tax=Sinomonas atrocyanea TaxID=37927 RepID=UPI00286438B9|nr:MFS transporter [Sinomonas atrocyanea]MDR6620166.1 DHA2 family multidrug resistance protein-like MFS transporter [Sinomonas atrocyanea]
MASTTPVPARTTFQGNDRLLLGIVLGVVTFWLFAGSMGTVAPNVLNEINGAYSDPAKKVWDHPLISPDAMNLAVSITALFSGMFIVIAGGLADRIGRVRISLLGNGLSILGALLIVFAAGPVALPLMLAGRAVQGLSAACIMPATMALVKTYWDGPGRQRAVSMWSIGSWGGSGLASILGGYVATFAGWRWIFIAAIVVSALSIMLMWGTPESRVVQAGPRRFDLPGVLVFVVAILSLMIVLIFGSKIGWGSPVTLGLLVVAVVGIIALVRLERRSANPFIDLALFKNRTFTGATVSNFLLNGNIGMLLVTQQLLQLAGGMKASDAGLLTLGYAVTIIAFIRVGEKLLQRFGPRRPMIWGSGIVGIAVILLMPTNLLLGQYQWFAIVAYALFGLGLAFYATPSTDAALANLPADKAGTGSGIYKMASSLGSAIGAAISLAVFTALGSTGAQFVGDVLTNHGRTDNIDLRQAAVVALVFNLLMVVVAIASIMMTVPKGREDSSTGK